MDSTKNSVILVIDDEIGPREALRMILKDTYTVLTARNAAEAYSVLDKHEVAVVLTDLVMPETDGIAVLKQVKDTYPDTEVVIVTAYASFETARQSIKQDVCDYLVKPFDRADVLLAVKKGIERRKTTQSVREQILQAEKINTLSTLACGLTHDLKNNLATIMMFTDLVKTANNDTLSGPATVIQKEVRQASQLINKLLTIGAAKKTEFAYFDINLTIAEVCRIYETIPPSVPVHVRSDPAIGLFYGSQMQIEQLMSNLLLNAKQASSDNGVIKVTTSVTEKDNGTISTVDTTGIKTSKFICITVGDQGTGMSPDVLSHIFDPFFTTKKGNKGTGLGLSVVQNIIEEHHGTRSVQSEKGKGTTFTIILPHREQATVLNTE